MDIDFIQAQIGSFAKFYEAIKNMVTAFPDMMISLSKLSS